MSTGCQWRALPKDLQPRSTVHGWFVRWHCDGVLDRLHFALYQQVRALEGRHATPPLLSWTARASRALKRGKHIDPIGYDAAGSGLKTRWVVVRSHTFIDSFADGQPVTIGKALHRRKRVVAVFPVWKVVDLALAA